MWDFAGNQGVPFPPYTLRYGKWYGGSNLLGSTWNFSRNPLEAWISKAAGMEEPTNGFFTS